MRYSMNRRGVLRAGLASSGAALLAALPAGRLFAQEP